jgi:hypothetical protein
MLHKLDSSGWKENPVVGYYEQNNRPFKGRQFLVHLSDYQLLEKSDA